MKNSGVAEGEKVEVHVDLTVVTHNMREFQNIPELRLEDWLVQ